MGHKYIKPVSSEHMSVFMVCMGFVFMLGSIAFLTVVVISRGRQAKAPLDINDEERAVDDHTNLMATIHRKGFRKTQKAA
jgi:hypothetical protein